MMGSRNTVPPRILRIWFVVSLRVIEKKNVIGEITHSAVRALPHLLQLEFLHSGLIRSDGRALDSDVVLQDGLGGVDRDLVVGLTTRETTSVPERGNIREQRAAGTYGVSGLESEVVVLDVEVEVRKDELRCISFDNRAHITVE